MQFVLRVVAVLLFALVGHVACSQARAPQDFHFEHLTVAQGLSHSDAMTVAQDQAGFIWVGTERTGLGYYDTAADSLPYFDQARVPGCFRPPRRVLSQVSISALTSDPQGRLWVSTYAEGLFVLTVDHPRHLTDLRRVPAMDLRQKPFGWLRRQLTGPATLANSHVNAIYKEEGRNTLWFGTCNGVASYNLTRQTYRNYFSQEQPGDARGIEVAAIFQTTNDNLWFGTRDYGLKCLRRRGGRAALVSYGRLPTGPDLAANSIESLAEDRFGSLWVATLTGGLVRLGQDGRLLAAYNSPNNALPTNSFTYLLYDRRRDMLWASTRDQGLLKLRVTSSSLQVLRQFRRPVGATRLAGLTVNYVWPLLLEGQGTRWIGTMGGDLHRLVTDSQGWKTIQSYYQYLLESDVESLLADEQGNLWLGGNGLCCFTPGTRRYVRYDVTDGLPNNAFKVVTAARTQDGTLYFGGINGISYFQPRAIRPNPYPAVVKITGLRIENRPVAVGKQLDERVVLPRPLAEPQTVLITADENDFAVEFVALNYANPQKTRYAYRLVGYSKGWVAPDPGQRSASFANLPAGHYRFEVKASNGEGGWAGQPAILQVEVREFWYQTWWAYLLYAGLLVEGTLLYWRVRMAQKKLQDWLALELFQQEKEQDLTKL